MDYRREDAGRGKRNGKPFPSSPYLEEGHVRGSGEERERRGSVSRRKLLPRDAVHINPRLAYCFPDQEKIYVRSLPLRTAARSLRTDRRRGRSLEGSKVALTLCCPPLCVPAKRPMRFLRVYALDS